MSFFLALGIARQSEKISFLFALYVTIYSRCKLTSQRCMSTVTMKFIHNTEAGCFQTAR